MIDGRPIDPEPQPSIWSERIRTALAFTFAAVFISAGTWASYWADHRNDQYQLINLGECVRTSGRMYVDCWENKPPGMAWLNAAAIALWPDGYMGAWLLPGVLAAVAILVFWGAVRAVFSRKAARRSVIIASLLATVRSYDAPSINPDFYSFSFELMAISLWMFGWVSESGRKAAAAYFGAGLVWAAAGSMKQVGGMGLLATGLVALVLMVARHPDRRKWGVGTGLAFLGLFFGVGMVVAALAAIGTLGEAWHAVFAFNTQFLRTGLIGTVLHSGPKLQTDLTPLQLPIWLAIMAAATLIISRRNRPVGPAWLAVMSVWAVAAGWFALVGPSGSMRYWQGTWVPLLWLSAAAVEFFNLAYAKADRAARVVLFLAFGTAVVLLLRPFAVQYRYGLAESYLAYDREPNQRDRLTEMGARIAELVPSGEKIYVLAYDVGPYLYAHRRPASRFTYPRSAEQMREILDVLSAGKAYGILVPTKPAGEFSRWCDEACSVAMGDLMGAYTKVERINGYDVRLRTARTGGTVP